MKIYICGEETDCSEGLRFENWKVP